LGAAAGNGFMGFPRVISTISRDAGDVLLIEDMPQKHWQNRSITDLVSRHFYGSDCHRTFIDPDMEFTPDTTFRTAMFEPMPFT
jgi:hypothetical protein